tara:strand:- start:8450 stop:8863 length:414 start_codon:yes stop_codon:yes gene_type:complete
VHKKNAVHHIHTAADLQPGLCPPGQSWFTRREADEIQFFPTFDPPEKCQNGAAALSAIHRAGAASAGDQNVETQNIPKIAPLARLFLRSKIGMFGAVEKTRTSTGCPTATSTLRVYQFRHDRTPKQSGAHNPKRVRL